MNGEFTMEGQNITNRSDLFFEYKKFENASIKIAGKDSLRRSEKDTPQQNVGRERENRTIIYMVRTFKYSSFQKQFGKG